MPARHFIVMGKVQGVFFRASAEQKAKELHLTGWVRNAKTSDVVVHAEGIEEKLRAFEQWLHKGPRGAHVTNVVSKAIPEEGFKTFSVLETE